MVVMLSKTHTHKHIGKGFSFIAPPMLLLRQHVSVGVSRVSRRGCLCVCVGVRECVRSCVPPPPPQAVVTFYVMMFMEIYFIEFKTSIIKNYWYL